MSTTAEVVPYHEDPLDAVLLAELLGMASTAEESTGDTSQSECQSVIIGLPEPALIFSRHEEDFSMGEASATESSASGMCSTSSLGSRRGRKAIPATFIENEDPRAVTFCKRKDGIVKKSNEIACMTGCSVILMVQQVPTDRPVNTYIHASSTWRGVPFSEAFRQLISTVHQPRRGTEYVPNKAYEENVFELAEGEFVNNEYVSIKDKPEMSNSSDVYCIISTGTERQIKPEDSSLFSSNIPKTPSYTNVNAADEEYSEDEDDIERSYFENCWAPVPKPQKRKREYSTTTLIPDQRTREICFNKRKEGLFKKAFELVALTNCHLFVAVSKPLRVGELTSHYYVYASPLLRTGPPFSLLMRTLDAAQVMDYYYSMQEDEKVAQLRQQAFEYFSFLMGHEDELSQAVEDSSERDSYLVPPTAIQPSTKNMRKKPAMCLTFAWKVPISEEHRSMTEAKKKKRKSKPRIPRPNRGERWGRKTPRTEVAPVIICGGNESEPSFALNGPRFMHSSVGDLPSIRENRIKPCISEDPLIPDTATENEMDIAERIARILVVHRASLNHPVAQPSVTPAVTAPAAPLPPPPLPKLANTSALEERSSRNRLNIRRGREVSSAFMFV
jgi:hypothetical protein